MNDDGPEGSDDRQVETGRLASLYRLDLLDEAHDERFERISRIASRALAAPFALVTLLDADDQRFCASFGFDIDTTPRADSFCNYAIIAPDDVLVVPDAHLDPKFAGVPFVTGTPYIRFYAGVAVKSPGGQPIGTVCVLDTQPRTFGPDDEALLGDLGALVERELLHTSVSLSESLTGLANRRAFMAAVDRFLPLGARRSEPVSVIFADVNDLKLVNDMLGHAEGDALLQRTAVALATSTRSSDVVARIGGDEFAVVLYDTDAEAVAAVIDKIRERVHADNEGVRSGRALSVAFGAATAQPDDTAGELVARADAAMVADKRSA